MNGNTRKVIDRLADYERRIRRLMEIVGDNGHLKLGSKAMAQQMMRMLKDDLRHADEEMSSVSGLMALSEVEAAFLRPAVHAAVAQLRSRWDSDPIRSRWLEQLRDALGAVVQAIDRLQQD